MKKSSSTLRTLATFGDMVFERESTAAPLIRLMQQARWRGGSIFKLLRALNVVLLISIVLHLVLCLHTFCTESSSPDDSPVRDFLYLLSVLFLVTFFVANFLLQQVLASKAESMNQRIDAMIYMFSSVKHSLNNDMQVVRGNAELAERVAEQGDSASKQIRHIVLAADDAIDRIEQLGAFSTSGTVKLQPADLNAALRHTMAKLTAKVPETTVLALELGCLQDRVMVDRFLFELSLSHLIRSTTRLLPDGCEILSRTHHGPAGSMRFVIDLKTLVRLDIMIRPKQAVPDNQSEQSALNDVAQDLQCLYSEMRTTKALLETSGAEATCIEISQKQLQLQLTFCCRQNDSQTALHPSECRRQDTPIRIPAAKTSEPPRTT